MEFRHFNKMRDRNNSTRRGYSTYIASDTMYSHKDKKELESLFPDNLLLETLKTVENPLKKNLGDAYNMDRSHESFFNRDSTRMSLEPDKVYKEILRPQPPPDTAWRPEFLQMFSGITNMISGFINNVAGVITLHYNHPTPPEKNVTADISALNANPLNIDKGLDFEGRDEADASPPIDDASAHFSPHDCAKNNLCENSGSLAQCSPRGGVAQAPPIAAMPLPTLQDPADTCQAKMAKIQDLLSGKSSPKPKVRPYSRYTPKKAFVDSKFVEENVVDVFIPEPVEHLQCMDKTNFVNLGVITHSNLVPAEILPQIKIESKHTEQLNTTKEDDKDTLSSECSQVKSDLEVKESVSLSNSTVMLGKVEPQFTETKLAREHNIDDKLGWQENSQDTNDMQAHDALFGMEIAEKNTPQKEELITSCEDKVTQLKVLLAERKNNKFKSTLSTEHKLSPDTKKEVKIHAETELNCPIPVPRHSQSVSNSDSEASTFENSPNITVTPPDSFNEIRGRFESNSSDDSFTIVFSESPNHSPIGSPRDRFPSTSSEDSFIVFKDDRSNCFTVDLEESDCESNLTSVGRYSQTVADLTDESLYCDDRDCHNSDDSESEDEDTVETVEEKSRGVLLTEEKIRARMNQPEKRVRFSEAPPKVHHMCVWSYAARQARIGNWQQAAADAERFKRRIADADMAISWVLKPAHRNRVKFQRFMPWWHAERRREEAERKAEEERKKKEEEARLAEEKRLEEERIAEEKRIEEEVREEMERERKSRKTISKEQFAMNLRIYLNKKKMQRASSPQVRIVPELPKHKPKQNCGCKKSDGVVITDSKVDCQNIVNGFDKDADRVTTTSNFNCETDNPAHTNETDGGQSATEKIVTSSYVTDTVTDNTAKDNIQVTVNKVANSDSVIRVNGLTEAVVIDQQRLKDD